MNEKQLISKLQSLKQIKPRENWVVFVKHEIMEGRNAVNAAKPREAIFSNIVNTGFQRRLAYAFAALAIAVFGLIGLQFMPASHETDEKETASLLTAKDSVMVKDSVEELKVKSQNLAEISKSNKADAKVARGEVSRAAKNLTNAIIKNPESAKHVAMELKNNGTLLSISSDNSDSDLKKTSDALYKTLDKQIIASDKNITFTEEEQIVIDEFIKLYEEGRYSEALETRLLINNK